LVQAAAELGGGAMANHDFTAAERETRRRNARRLNLAQHLKQGYHGPRWTAEQLAFLGTLLDAKVANRFGRTTNAVRIMRAARYPLSRQLAFWMG